MRGGDEAALLVRVEQREKERLPQRLLDLPPALRHPSDAPYSPPASAVTPVTPLRRAQHATPTTTGAAR